MPIASNDLDAALARLRAGGLVAFPTETVYGLGADARRADAVARVFAIKGRPSRNPLIVHVADAAMARACAATWPEAAQRLADACWPGPLSIVVPRAAVIPDLVAAGGPSVALRCPDHPLTLELLRRFGGPLVGPSANPSGGVSPTRAEHVRDAFDPADVLVLDGGPCRGGIESTVIDCTGAAPRVLRPGLVTPQRLGAILGGPVAVGALPAADGSALPSPGLLDRHYAPNARARLFTTRTWAEALAQRPPDRGAVVLAREPYAVPEGVRLVLMPRDAAGYASALYAALRDADRADPGLMLIEAPPESGPDADLWAAIADRLTRACTP